MLFYFKQHPTDFIVDEVLRPEQWADDGQYRYIRIQKEDYNTMDIIHHLTTQTSLTRRQMMVSWLKDKKAITTQRIAIHRDDCATAGGEDVVRKSLREVVKILDEKYSNQPRGIGRHRANRFTIRLRAKKETTSHMKGRIEAKIAQVQQYGFPNCFGQQRFWRRNIQRAMDFFNLDHVPDPETNYHLKLKLQAFPSLYFNQLAVRRYESGDFLLDGDILVYQNDFHHRQYGVYDEQTQTVAHFDYAWLKEQYEHRPYITAQDVVQTTSSISDRSPTGLMMGGRMLLAPDGTAARKREDALLDAVAFFPLREQLARAYHLRWHRRPLSVIPESMTYDREGDDLIIDMTLPVGAYATVVLWRIFRDIDPETVKQCGWMIETSG